MSSDKNDPLRLDRQVCFPLYAASNLLNRLYRPILGKLGLTYPQYLVMLALWERSPQTVGSLGNILYLDSGTLTPLLKRMEAGGLLTRERDAEDSRRVLVQLTSEGRALRKRAVHVPKTLAKGLHLASTDIDGLRSSVQEMVQLLTAKDSLDAVRNRTGSELARGASLILD